jgi:hypothetical protein
VGGSFPVTVNHLKTKFGPTLVENQEIAAG